MFLEVLSCKWAVFIVVMFGLVCIAKDLSMQREDEMEVMIESFGGQMFE